MWPEWILKDSQTANIQVLEYVKSWAREPRRERLGFHYNDFPTLTVFSVLETQFPDSFYILERKIINHSEVGQRISDLSDYGYLKCSAFDLIIIV